MRRTSLLAALLAATVLPALPAPAAPAAPCGRAAAERAGRWWVAQPPAPASSAAREATHLPGRHVRAVAVDPADPRVVVVVSDSHVHRSDDGGCTWTRVWGLGPEDVATQITSVDVAHVGGRSRVLLTVLSDLYRVGAEVVRLQVVRSADGRTGWTPAYETVGTLTAAQDESSIRVRSGAGGVPYAVVPTLAGTFGWVRGSADATTWESRTGGALTAVTGAAVSPWNADEVWEWGYATGEETAALRRSTDGARTWQRVDPWPTRDEKPVWSAADVAWPRRGGAARVAVVGGSGNMTTTDSMAAVAWSGDGGSTFGLSFPPKRLRMFDAPTAHTPRGDLILVAADGTVFRLPNAGRPPRTAQWVRLPSLPPRNTLDGYGVDYVRASATTPTVVAVPDLTSLRLLTVSP